MFGGFSANSYNSSLPWPIFKCYTFFLYLFSVSWSFFFLHLGVYFFCILEFLFSESWNFFFLHLGFSFFCIVSKPNRGGRHWLPGTTYTAFYLSPAIKASHTLLLFHGGSSEEEAFWSDSKEENLHRGHVLEIFFIEFNHISAAQTRGEPRARCDRRCSN